MLRETLLEAQVQTIAKAAKIFHAAMLPLCFPQFILKRVVEAEDQDNSEEKE